MGDEGLRSLLQQRAESPLISRSASAASISEQDSDVDEEVEDVSAILKLALLWRGLLLAIGLATTFFVPDFDFAGRLALGLYDGYEHKSMLDYAIRRLLLPLLRWDALYFVDITREGYLYEQEHAFFPLLPLTARMVSGMLEKLSCCLLTQRTLDLLAGVLITNVSFLFACWVFYELSVKALNNQKAAIVSAKLFSVQPCGLFMSSFYTESPFALLAFSGMLCVHKRELLKASLLFGLSSLTRSNGILFTGFFIYEYLRGRLRLFMLPVLAAVTCSGFLIFQAYGYLEFCRDNMRSWCIKALPFAYSFVQDHYWNVGFMRYWELKQIPNFLFAAPMLALTSTAVYSYVKFDPSRIRILRSLKEAKYPFFQDALLPYIVLQAFLVFYGLFMMHVQVVTRMFSSSPVVFWFAGHLCQHARYRKLVLYYFTWYSIIGAVLFSAFYPPA